jgi:hypothetical protein
MGLLKKPPGDYERRTRHQYPFCNRMFTDLDFY